MKKLIEGKRYILKDKLDETLFRNFGLSKTVPSKLIYLEENEISYGVSFERQIANNGQKRNIKFWWVSKKLLLQHLKEYQEHIQEEMDI